MTVPGLDSGFGINKSLFSKKTFKYAIGDDNTNGYSVIKIEPKGNAFTKRQDPGIKGVIQNNLEMSMNADWEPLESIGGLVPSIFSIDKLADWYTGAKFFDPAARAVGFAERGVAFSSRKIYHKSGYLEINPQMRIVNWYDDFLSSPMIAAIILMNYCLPGDAINGYEKLKEFIRKNLPGVGVLLDKIQGASREAVEKAVNAAKDEFGTDVVDTVLNFGQKFGDAALAGGNEVFQDLDDYQILRKSPTPVRVTIGRYFQHDDMVIENVNFSFSREQTRLGPLYVDVGLRLSSRKRITDIEYSGLTYGNKYADKVNLIGSDEASTPLTFN